MSAITLKMAILQTAHKCVRSLRQINRRNRRSPDEAKLNPGPEQPPFNSALSVSLGAAGTAASIVPVRSHTPCSTALIAEVGLRFLCLS
jgi:hypothetical protein